MTKRAVIQGEQLTWDYAVEDDVEMHSDEPVDQMDIDVNMSQSSSGLGTQVSGAASNG